MYNNSLSPLYGARPEPALDSFCRRVTYGLFCGKTKRAEWGKLIIVILVLS